MVDQRTTVVHCSWTYRTISDPSKWWPSRCSTGYDGILSRFYSWFMFTLRTHLTPLTYAAARTAAFNGIRSIPVNSTYSRLSRTSSDSSTAQWQVQELQLARDEAVVVCRRPKQGDVVVMCALMWCWKCAFQYLSCLGCYVSLVWAVWLTKPLWFYGVKRSTHFCWR